MAELRRQDIPLTHTARQFALADFTAADVILAMDTRNARDLHACAPTPAARAKIALVRDFTPGGPPGQDVPDPYGGGPDHFHHIFEVLDAACGGLLAQLARTGPPPTSPTRLAPGASVHEGPPVNDDPYRDEPDTEGWSLDPSLADDEVGMAITGFFLLVAISPGDAPFARLGIEAVVRALGDSSGPDAPTPGMMGVPVLIEDGLARAALADASPAAREALGDLERAVVRVGPDAAAAIAERIRMAIRAANARLAGAGWTPHLDPPPGGITR